MNRPLAGFLMGTAMLAQAALASSGASADVGRYQLVPNAMVPNKSGEMQEQTVLLDTSTGRTWHLGNSAQSGSGKGPRWVPLDITFADRVNAAANTPKPAERRAADTKPIYNMRNKRLGEDYDNDP